MGKPGAHDGAAMRHRLAKCGVCMIAKRLAANGLWHAPVALSTRTTSHTRTRQAVKLVMCIPAL